MSLTLATPAGTAQQPPFQVTEASIVQTQAALRAGKVTCRQLVQSFLARIAAYDQTDIDQTAHLNTVVTLNPSALADADRLDADFARTHTLRPLQGIAVVVKDNYNTRGLQTTGGSLALKSFLPAEDAHMVKLLRDAGAIVLFKSNMAEWAFSPVFTESSIAGITRNPYDLSRVPAGSSGGTAAAVSASFGAVGLGTDTGDSIRGPASHAALVGIRPTLGLTSRAGIVPLFLTADVGGPLARTVADAAAVLNVVAGFDPDDPITEQSRGKIPPDYTAFLDPHGLRGARIGVFRRYLDASTGDPAIKALTERALADLKAQGAILVDTFDIPDFESLTKGISCGDFQADLNQYLATYGQTAQYHTLQQIYDSGLYLPATGPRIQRALNPGAPAPVPSSANPVPAAPAATASNLVASTAPAAPKAPCQDVWHDPKKIAFRNAILAAMDAAHLDAIVYPTWSNPPRKVGDLKSPAGDNNQVLSPQSGLPAITVPMGFTQPHPGATLPAGLQFLARPFAEPTLIRLAYAYEQANRHRQPPALFPPLP